MEKLVTLNVGGTLFTVPLRTLLAVPNTFFTALLGEMDGKRTSSTPSCGSDEDEDENLFIDRDPTHFHHIVNYLTAFCGNGEDPSHQNDDARTLPQYPTGPEFHEELLFYGLVPEHLADTQNDPVAQFLLGVCYYCCFFSITKNVHAGRFYLYRSALVYDVARHTHLIWFQEKDTSKIEQQEAVAALRHAGERGDACACFTLALTYGWLTDTTNHSQAYQCTVVRNSYEEAMVWYLKAVELGLGHAISDVGFLKFSGFGGVPKNVPKGLELYETAMGLGVSHAYFHMGTILAFENTIPRDPQKAIEYFKIASEQGHVGATYYLGICYSNGLDPTENVEKAIELWAQAAKGGEAVAVDNIVRNLLPGNEEK